MPGMTPSPYLAGLGHPSIQHSPPAPACNSSQSHHRTTTSPCLAASPRVTSSRAMEQAVINERYQTMLKADLDKNAFFADLIAANEKLTVANEKLTTANEKLVITNEQLNDENRRLTDEQGRSNDSVQQWRNEKRHYEQIIDNYQTVLAENPYVVALIDGNGLLFHTDAIRDGTAGGRQAAIDLKHAIEEYIRDETTDIPFESRIVVRIYADCGMLAKLLVGANEISKESTFIAFTRGFMSASDSETALFDFVDVGLACASGVHSKMSEHFALNAANYSCRRILFGCARDNPYESTLLPFLQKPEVVGKTTLIGGIPFGDSRPFSAYSRRKFPGILRDVESLFSDEYDHIDLGDDKDLRLSTSMGRQPLQGQLMDSPLPSRATLAHQLPRTPSHTSLDSIDAAVNKLDVASSIATRPTAPKPTVAKTMVIKSTATKPTANQLTANQPNTNSAATQVSVGKPPNLSWATTVASPAPPFTGAPEYKPISREHVVARNRLGERVDPPCKDYDKAEVDRVKKIKMCNVHYLRNECPYGRACTHAHEYHPTTNELGYLRLVARMAPCQYGSGCADVKCIYGHRCPAPPSKNRYAAKGKKNCLFGDSCKFPAELHDIDTNVVKTLVVNDK